MPAPLHAESAVQRVQALQAVAGNAAVAHAVRRTASVRLQRVEDPDGDLLAGLRIGYQRLYRTYKLSLPKPSDMTATIKRIVAAAENADAAVTALRDDVYGRFPLTQDVPDLRKSIEDAIQAARRKSNEEQSAKRKRLKEFRAREKQRRDDETKGDDESERRDDDSKRPTKRRRTVTNPSTAYSKKEKRLVRRKFEDPQFRRKIIAASAEGYEQHYARARDGIEALARDSELKEAGTLHSADLAAVHRGAGRERMGDALVLEEGITMLRAGQQIHQLGPYVTTARRTGIEDEIAKALKTHPKLNARQLATALSIADRTELTAYLKAADAIDLLKWVRAMRNLHAVELARGPEVALGTSLALRSAGLGIIDFSDYPSYMPLAPEKATANLTKARQTSGVSGTSDRSKYVPPATLATTFNTVRTFVLGFMDDPREQDVEGHKLVRAIADEQSDPDPSDMLIDACAGILRTPQQLWADFEFEGAGDDFEFEGEMDRVTTPASTTTTTTTTTSTTTTSTPSRSWSTAVVNAAETLGMTPDALQHALRLRNKTSDDLQGMSDDEFCALARDTSSESVDEEEEYVEYHEEKRPPQGRTSLDDDGED